MPSQFLETRILSEYFEITPYGNIGFAQQQSEESNDFNKTFKTYNLLGKSDAKKLWNFT